MRIAMILDKTFPPDPRVENEAVSLIKDGHQVFLFCLRYSENILSSECYKGIQVERFKSTEFEYKLSALAYDFPLYRILMSKKVTAFLKSQKFDVIHIHDIRIASAVFKANKHFNLPVILDLHDNLPEVMKLYPHLQKFPGKYLINPKRWKKNEEIFIKKADKVITVSPEFISEVKGRVKVDNDKLVLVPNSVLSAFYTKATYKKSIIENFDKKFVLLYLGDTHIRRGLLTAIEAVKKIKETITNIKLIIVGKSTTDTILKAKVKELALEDYVVFEGWQDVALFPSYIKVSSICISPLYRNIQHDVAYANKLFQYMSFGKPLLVSDATAQSQLVSNHKTGLVHREKDSDDFAEKILTLYDNPKLMKQLGESGENFVKNQFSWEQTSKELLKLYRDLEA